MTQVPVRVRVIHHVRRYRMYWTTAIAVTFFLLGWVLHNEKFQHWAEFTLAPVLEAIMARHMD